ncbi:DNA polymerase III subunit delta' [Enterobacteriaceae bacterium LUAb1]
MTWYPWLNLPYRQRIEQHQQGMAHHAVLFCALPGMGTEALVWGLSRWLLCQKREGMKSCGQCHGCKLMQAGNHPDWYHLAAEKGKKGTGIDAVRKLNEALWQHAQQGGARVVWIPDAIQLTGAAANALLKTLEEPPQHCWFLLECDEPMRLLATLRSRCLQWRLTPPPEQQSLAWLRKQHPVADEALLTALQLCGGAPAAAQALLVPDLWNLRQQLCTALAHIAAGGDLLALLPVLNHDTVAHGIHWLCTLLLDVQKCYQAGGQGICNRDQLSLITALTRWLPAPVVDESLRQWLRCRDKLLHVVAVNRELLLTERLLTWERDIQSASRTD